MSASYVKVKVLTGVLESGILVKCLHLLARSARQACQHQQTLQRRISNDKPRLTWSFSFPREFLVTLSQFLNPSELEGIPATC